MGWAYLQLAGMPKTVDLAIFFVYDDRQTDCFTPCACARGNDELQRGM